MASETKRTDVDLGAKLFGGFGDRTRLAVLAALDRTDLRVTDLVETLGGRQSTVSGHLACLKDCGLIVGRSEGRRCSIDSRIRPWPAPGLGYNTAGRSPMS